MLARIIILLAEDKEDSGYNGTLDVRNRAEIWALADIQNLAVLYCDMELMVSSRCVF